MEQVLLQLLALGDVEPHPEDLARTALLVADQHGLIEEVRSLSSAQRQRYSR